LAQNTVIDGVGEINSKELKTNQPMTETINNSRPCVFEVTPRLKTYTNTPAELTAAIGASSRKAVYCVIPH
jgi:hypothetical protein